jgi:hypothetical protein
MSQMSEDALKWDEEAPARMRLSTLTASFCAWFGDALPVENPFAGAFDVKAVRVLRRRCYVCRPFRRTEALVSS